MVRAFWVTTAFATLSAAFAVVPAGQAQAQQASGEEEVLVTARKREETLREVPAAGVALGGQALEQLQIVTIEDLARVVPGAVATGNGPDYLRAVTIRGAGAGRNAESNTAVGLYKNGIFNAGGFFGGRSFTKTDLFDVERIEVLRGPQGALFGRNAVGGAMNVVSARPTQDFSVRAGAGVSSFETRSGELVVNVPIGAGWAVRAGAFGEMSDGSIENIAEDGPEYGDSEYIGGRLTVSGPITDHFTVTGIIEGQRNESPGFSGVFRNVALDEDDRIANSPSNSIVDEVAGTIEIVGDFGATRFTSITVARHRTGQTEDDIDAFQCAFGDGNGWSATSAQGLPGAGTNTCATNGATGSPTANANAQTPFAEQIRDGEFTRLAQEVRLDGSVGERLRWLLGADILVDMDQQVRLDAGSADSTGTTDTDLFPDADSLTDIDQDTKSCSVFGSLDYDITPTVTGSVEVRYLDETRESTIVRTPADSSCAAAPAAPQPAIQGRCTTPINYVGEISDTQTLPTVSLRWTPDEMVTIYARYATGSRPGGFNNFAGAAFTYEPEVSASAELGFKVRPTRGLDVNLAVYRSEIEDAQLSARESSGTGVILSNIGTAEIMGLEADLRWAFRFAGGRVVATGGASVSGGEYQDSVIVNYPGSCPLNNAYELCPQSADGATRNLAFVPYDIQGVAVAQIPSFQANLGLTYTRQFGNDWQWDVSGNYTHRNGGAEEVAPRLDPSDPAFALLNNSFQNLDDYNVFDIRTSIGKGGWTLALFGRNVTDDRYILENNGNGAGAKQILSPPTTWGANLTVEF